MAKLLKFYHRWREILTIVGYFVMLGTIISSLWIGFCFIEQANANTTAILELQTWKLATTVSLARFEQKVDDIYRVTVGKEPPQ